MMVGRLADPVRRARGPGMSWRRHRGSLVRSRPGASSAGVGGAATWAPRQAPSVLVEVRVCADDELRAIPPCATRPRRFCPHQPARLVLLDEGGEGLQVIGSAGFVGDDADAAESTSTSGIQCRRSNSRLSLRMNSNCVAGERTQSVTSPLLASRIRSACHDPCGTADQPAVAGVHPPLRHKRAAGTVFDLYNLGQSPSMA